MFFFCCRRSPSRSPAPSARQRHHDYLGRTQSFKNYGNSHRVFRATDLVHGEVLGKGFFGQAIKVCLKVVLDLSYLFKFTAFYHLKIFFKTRDYCCCLKCGWVMTHTKILGVNLMKILNFHPVYHHSYMNIFWHH